MTDGPSCSIAVVGGGPAGLMAAEVLAASGADVTVYDRMPTLARKLLMAGRGGLNLTHSEDFARLAARYGDREKFLRLALETFPPAAARAWCKGLGQPTFVGSSGRVFPKSMKASPLLRAWLGRLAQAGVIFRTRQRWLGWDDAGRLTFDTPEGETAITADAVILALGGASWPRLGSTGDWVPLLGAAGVGIAPLVPANCGFIVEWTEEFARRFQGQPLKRIALSFADRSVRGEALVTARGLEGGAVYALSGALRDAIAAGAPAELSVDLRPDVSLADLAARLAKPRGKQSLSTFLRKVASLSPVEIGLLHESAHAQLAQMNPMALAGLIKAVPLRLMAPAPIETAISTAGGVAWDAVDEHLMLHARPGAFVAGEMLDWEAPTGGYLLQACLATGALAGRGALQWLARR
ncbi:TIGR03862 family flavoprotein [Hyphomicrobium sp. xq]|uniref:TIGR03862 family flavoprotein n=1 Tax=Hyphomicrobium album TaxID=2665159 RepID=A0A6I3KRP5_9HYPH|nr:TIGR03862 family flavoprotein [Hyphomicrobium album]